MNNDLERLISQQTETAKDLQEKESAKLRGKREDFHLLVERENIRQHLETIIPLVAPASPGISLYGIQSALNSASGYEYKLCIPRRRWKGGYSRYGLAPAMYAYEIGVKKVTTTITPAGDFHIFLYRESPAYDPAKIAIRRRWNTHSLPPPRGGSNDFFYKDYALVEVADFGKKVEQLFKDVLENSEPYSEEEVQGMGYPGTYRISYGKANIGGGVKYLQERGLARISWDRKFWE